MASAMPQRNMPTIQPAIMRTGRATCDCSMLGSKLYVAVEDMDAELTGGVVGLVTVEELVLVDFLLT